MILRLSLTVLSLAVNPEMAPFVGRENTFEISCNDDWMIKVRVAVTLLRQDAPTAQQQGVGGE